VVKYVIELGYHTKTATGTDWVSKGFYNLYQPNGGPMIVVPKQQDAYRFDRHSMAENVVGGDDRIKNNCRIVEVRA
jgi:hypothetical protein